jgi:hypothetical protein
MVKVKVKLSLCLIKYHTMRKLGGGGELSCGLLALASFVVTTAMSLRLQVFQDDTACPLVNIVTNVSNDLCAFIFLLLKMTLRSVKTPMTISIDTA